MPDPRKTCSSRPALKQAHLHFSVMVPEGGLGNRKNKEHSASVQTTQLGEKRDTLPRRSQDAT